MSNTRADAAILYTQVVTRDLAGIARIAGATVIGRSIALNTFVDDALTLDEFTVVGHTDYVSLVFISASDFRAIVDATDPRLSVLSSSVLVTTETNHPLELLQAKVEAAGITMLLCPDVDLDGLRLRIAMTLAEDRAAEARLVTTGTKVLTQVARRGGVGAVVVELAHRLNGWVVLLDSQGQAITSAGAGALHLKDAVAVAFHRPVRVRHPGLQVHPVGEAGDLRAFLVVASRHGNTSRTRDLAAQAAALLDLLLRTHDHSETEQLGRELMMAALLAGPAMPAERLLRRVGVRDGSLTGFVLSSRTKSVDLERLVLRWLDELGAAHIVTREKERIIGLLPDDLVGDLEKRVEAFVLEAQVPLRCGIGSSASVDALSHTITEARQAHDVALVDNRAVAAYAALPTVNLLLNSLDVASLAHVARSLDPLRGKNGAYDNLMQTLRVYLAEHGSWGVAAERLGIHRHTLKNRILHIEKLTGLSMSSADDRFTAWLAMRAAGHRAISR
jgi:purine catabolism regulator